jgi:YfiH family protein
MSKIYRPQIFAQFPEVVAVLTLRDDAEPGEFTMGPTEDEIATANRAALAQQLGFDPSRLVTHHQVHGQNTLVISDHWEASQADGAISRQPGWLLTTKSADCLSILLYDPKSKAYGSIHSGWRGSSKNIVGKAIGLMDSQFQTNPANLYGYVGPGACGKCYEVRRDVYEQFDPKYFKPKSAEQWYFDNQAVVIDQLLGAGVSQNHIEVDHRCTMEDPELFSARRDQTTGRRRLEICQRFWI